MNPYPDGILFGPDGTEDSSFEDEPSLPAPQPPSSPPPAASPLPAAWAPPVNGSIADLLDPRVTSAQLSSPAPGFVPAASPAAANGPGTFFAPGFVPGFASPVASPVVPAGVPGVPGVPGLGPAASGAAPGHASSFASPVAPVGVPGPGPAARGPAPGLASPFASPFGSAGVFGLGPAALGPASPLAAVPGPAPGYPVGYYQHPHAAAVPPPAGYYAAAAAAATGFAPGQFPFPGPADHPAVPVADGLQQLAGPQLRPAAPARRRAATRPAAPPVPSPVFADGTKRCTVCKQIKSLEEFRGPERSLGGRSAAQQCNDCARRKRQHTQDYLRRKKEKERRNGGGGGGPGPAAGAVGA
ncbi:hypothetical protein QBC33DRAFT_516301 [Phialemonium atrogriseum]|uniref:Uncharacterized protein n=1 Tax=Phialemonium atrogriseum TaxID=1093897 RepID=A0AAJ0C1B0_9PEZI|nr:uncharacterized protein QBC33DRAFT_516301 [Phialemonium atrogriseum]KAK1765876.1 hypothetical protein QBC33DRAFT_516301 [Phialemonium atrogriseum]